MLGLQKTVGVVMAAATVTLAAPASKTGRTKTGIAFDLHGQGPAVVLITGSNLDRRMWTGEAAWLQTTHTVVRYDLRAHGESDTATMPFSAVDDLFEVLDEVGIQRATLIGLSAGSTIALDAALAQPGRVERLVLAGPAIGGYVSKVPPPFTADLIAALQQRDYRSAGEVLLASTVFTVAPDSRAVVRQMVMENERLWSVPRGLVRQPDRPALERLEEVRIPTLVVVGENDQLQRESAEILGRRIGGARLVVVPGGGHIVNLTSPDAFRAEVSRFLP
jgi:pimeloyl-ACP methyl ester carboxylesterase